MKYFYPAIFEDDDGKIGVSVPVASSISDIKTDGIVSLVLADTEKWRKQFDSSAGYSVVGSSHGVVGVFVSV